MSIVLVLMTFACGQVAYDGATSPASLGRKTYALPWRSSRPEWVLVGRSLRIVTSPFTSTYL